jgi:hypothetical protein
VRRRRDLSFEKQAFHVDLGWLSDMAVLDTLLAERLNEQDGIMINSPRIYSK